MNDDTPFFNLHLEKNLSEESLELFRRFSDFVTNFERSKNNFYRSQFRISENDGIGILKKVLKECDIDNLCCPKCGCEHTHLINTERDYKVRKKSHLKHLQKFKCDCGNIFSCDELPSQFIREFDIPLKKIITVIVQLLETPKTIQKTNIANSVEVSEDTVNKIHMMMKRKISSFFDTFIIKLGHSYGLDSFGETEVDESWFQGKIKHNRGNANPTKKLVFGMIDRITKLVVLKYVQNQQIGTLIPIIQKHQIKENSIIYTDGLASYTCLGRLGYLHKVVNHSTGFKSLDGTHINNIEGDWTIWKTIMKLQNGCEAKYLQGNLDKYMFIRLCHVAKCSPTYFFLKLFFKDF